MSDLLRAPLNQEVPANGNPGNAGSRFEHWTKLWLAAAAEALKCLGLGARDALSPRIFIRSAALCIAASLLWIWIYVRFFQEMLEFFGTLAVISFAGCFFQGPSSSFPILHAGSGSNAAAAVNPLGVMPGVLMASARKTALKRYSPSAPTPERKSAGKSRVRSVILLLVGLCIPVLSGYLIVLGMCYLTVRLL